MGEQAERAGDQDPRPTGLLLGEARADYTSIWYAVVEARKYVSLRPLFLGKTLGSILPLVPVTLLIRPLLFR